MTTVASPTSERTSRSATFSTPSGSTPAVPVASRRRGHAEQHQPADPRRRRPRRRPCAGSRGCAGRRRASTRSAPARRRPPSRTSAAPAAAGAGWSRRRGGAAPAWRAAGGAGGWGRPSAQRTTVHVGTWPWPPVRRADPRLRRAVTSSRSRNLRPSPRNARNSARIGRNPDSGRSSQPVRHDSGRSFADVWPRRGAPRSAAVSPQQWRSPGAYPRSRR